MTGIELLEIIFLLLFSAFFSASEMAFILANKMKLQIKAKGNSLSAQNAVYFSKFPDKLFSTVLIGNNITNITFASLLGLILQTKYHFDELQILLLSSLLLLLFGEITPKYLVADVPNKVFLFAAVPLRIVSSFFYPIVVAVSSLTKLFIKKENQSGESLVNLFHKDDFELLVQESQAAGHVTKEEGDVIKNILDLREQPISQCTRPRTELVGVEVSSSIEDVLDAFIESGYSKLPVYKKSLDNIIGFVLTYDLFKSPESLKSITRDIIFVPETKKSSEMLKEFLAKRTSIAVVIDEFGGTTGIVTIEDIIEELFGEIKDEYDIEEKVCRKLKEGEYLISGNVEVEDINEKFGLMVPLGEYVTIAGFIMNVLANIPKQGEKITVIDIELLIVRATSNKIELVKIKKLEA